MVYDTFIFLNEFEILDIRFRELENVVDTFVIVEAGETHSGKPKPFFFEEKAQWFARWLHKVIHVKVDKIPPGYPDKPIAYAREHSHRDCTIHGLKAVQADDYVMVGDVDEIPSAEGVLQAKLLTDHQGSVWFNQPLYYYYLNNFMSPVWNGTRMVKGNFFHDPQNTATMCKSVWTRPGCELKNAGWHFSWMGSAEKLSYKLASFMHQEWNQPQYNNLPNFQKSLDTGEDFWGRPHKGTIVPLDKMPQCVRDNPSSYAALLKTKW